MSEFHTSVQVNRIEYEAEYKPAHDFDDDYVYGDEYEERMRSRAELDRE